MCCDGARPRRLFLPRLPRSDATIAICTTSFLDRIAGSEQDRLKVFRSTTKRRRERTIERKKARPASGEKAGRARALGLRGEVGSHDRRLRVRITGWRL